MRRYAYAVVDERYCKDAETKLNQFGEQGWLIIACVWTSMGSCRWTLMRESTDGLR